MLLSSSISIPVHNTHVTCSTMKWYCSIIIPWWYYTFYHTVYPKVLFKMSFCLFLNPENVFLFFYFFYGAPTNNLSVIELLRSSSAVATAGTILSFDNNLFSATATSEIFSQAERYTAMNVSTIITP